MADSDATPALCEVAHNADRLDAIEEALITADSLTQLAFWIEEARHALDVLEVVKQRDDAMAARLSMANISVPMWDDKESEGLLELHNSVRDQYRRASVAVARYRRARHG